MHYKYDIRTKDPRIQRFYDIFDKSGSNPKISKFRAVSDRMILLRELKFCSIRYDDTKNVSIVDLKYYCDIR